jgi:hypothetical protein
MSDPISKPAYAAGSSSTACANAVTGVGGTTEPFLTQVLRSGVTTYPSKQE